MNKKIHFTGIGGIGVSALAQYYLEKSYNVTGSDLEKSEITDFLENKGVKIFLGKQTGKGITKDTQMVIHSPAISQENPDLKKAKKLGIKILSYPEALGKLTQKHFSICISGTHGKSTTTSMLSFILEQAGLDPTVIVGTKLKEFGDSNFKKGKSKYFLIEADEYADSFLNYHPNVIVLTNIEKDHLDYFKNLKDILDSFEKYVSNLEKAGKLIANGKDKNIKKIAKQDFYDFTDIDQSKKEKIKEVLQVPGKHNILNAQACFKTGEVLEIKERDILEGIKKYKGAWRRFEEKEINIKGENKKLIFDYGHHPTEILATCKAAREKFEDKKIALVFQPHQYKRTSFLFEEFLEAFKKLSRDKIVNKIFITDIYDVAGREEKNGSLKISSEKITKKLEDKAVSYLPEKEIEKHLNQLDEDILLIMGAGDIYKKYKQIID